MKTVLQIAQDLAPECGIDRPSVFATATEEMQDELLLLRCMNEAGLELRSRFDWPELRNKITITSTGNAPIVLPNDYSRLTKGWGVSVSSGVVRGSISDDEFNRLPPIEGVPRYFRTTGFSIELWPHMPVGQTANVSYQSLGWLSDGGEIISIDGSMPLFSDELLHKGTLWRWRRANGQDFKDWLDEFEGSLEIHSKFAKSERLP